MHPVRMGICKRFWTDLPREATWGIMNWWWSMACKMHLDHMLVEVILPALFGLGLDVLNLLLELLGTSVLGGLKDATQWAASEVVLDHALCLADDALLFASERGCQVELGCGAFAFAHCCLLSGEEERSERTARECGCRMKFTNLFALQYRGA